jgi:uncharacterized protein with PQ loop repeat
VPQRIEMITPLGFLSGNFRTWNNIPMENLTIRFLRILHIGIVFFVIFGCLFDSRTVLKLHVLFVPLMILHWKTNNGRCFLTNLEYRLKGVPLNSIETEDGFIKSLLKYFMKTLPSDIAIRRGIYVVALACWLQSLCRLL